MSLPLVTDSVFLSHLKSHRVIVRVDFNVPLQNGVILDDTRIRQALPTLHYLYEQGAQVVLLAHFGRPKICSPDTSLAFLTPVLSDMMKTPVLWAQTIADVPVPTGPQIVLLENIRYNVGEEKNEPTLAETWAKSAALYVNEAFSCAHRTHASVVAITHYLPSAAGIQLARETAMLDAILDHPKRPLLAIVGGAKVSTKLPLLEQLMNKADYLFLGGAMANTFLAAQGVSVGASLMEPDYLPLARDMLNAQKQCQLILPKDVRVLTAAGDVAERMVGEIHSEDKAMDIGSQTIARLKILLSDIETVVWNGPVGVFEDSRFALGSAAIGMLVGDVTTKRGITSVAGGGDTLASFHQHQEWTHVSTAGGAFLEWLEGKTLPGIQALMTANQRACAQ